MDKETINTYNIMAKDYDLETEDFWKRFPHTFLDKFIELSGQKIIDIGSGPGRDGLLLQGAGKDVVCLDASEVMIKISSDKGLRSILGDFNDLPFEDQSFDAVWSYTALLHVPKRSIDIPLKEISRVIRHSGVFALGLIEGNTEEYKESSGVNMPRWFSFYEKDEVIELCKRYDFELVYFETFKPRTKNYLNFIFRKS